MQYCNKFKEIAFVPNALPNNLATPYRKSDL